jgi:uracil-DNA glycosylase
MRSIEQLLEAVEREARRAPFPVDEPVYRRVGRDPLVPILFAGSLEAPLCSVGRDLGKDEVAAGEPQIGAAGRLVRAGVYRAMNGGQEPPAADRRLEPALSRVLLTNTVPYKPPGNKAYSAAVRERFRPFLAELLTLHWEGDRVLSLGTEAFRWFEPYAEPGAADAFWRRDDRYEAELPCELVVETQRGPRRKAIRLAPLPHPSPLNQRWYAKFPELLAGRLRGH